MNSSKKGDIVVCTEISRLGRSLIMIMNILQFFLDREIKVWTIKDGYRLGNDIQSKVLAFAFGISERTKIGLQRARKEGKRIGRKAGQKSKKYKLSPYDEYIKFQLIYGRTKASLARELGVTRSTLENHLKRIMFN